MAETFRKVDPSTIRTAAQLTAERMEKVSSMRYGHYWTADACIAAYTESGVMYFMTESPEDNPIFANIDEATTQLIRDGKYIIGSDKLESVAASKSVISAGVDELNLTNGIYDTYFEINTFDVKGGYGLNPAQRVFAERAFGQGEAFEDAMLMLRKSWIRKTRIYFINSGEAWQMLDGKRGTALVHVCRLNEFGHNSSFATCYNSVGNKTVSLRAEPKSS